MPTGERGGKPQPARPFQQILRASVQRPRARIARFSGRIAYALSNAIHIDAEPAALDDETVDAFGMLPLPDLAAADLHAPGNLCESDRLCFQVGDSYAAFFRGAPSKTPSKLSNSSFALLKRICLSSSSFSRLPTFSVMIVRLLALHIASSSAVGGGPAFWHWFSLT
jgi:hypothetical protein